ncbi:MAG: site-specific DNA-methyltransferase [Anaerolineaceae bacterium]|nr:site-specific DNA-methyltransferase [Anaerolineaceae bacterium]
MNQIYFSDNLTILKTLPDESVDLICIDPPFNTGKKQKRTSIKTVRSENGDRKGFQGNSYETIELGTKAYNDSFDQDTNELSPDIENAYNVLAPQSSVFFLEEFLRPRLIEAYRILKSHGSLYFHIDYREVHYCKILLDNIFGRECFLNEIIWAYDFGGRARSKWPAKHDNILFYVKDPKKYIFSTNDSDRLDYMAPGLVGPEKASRGKLPTDTWWWTYIGRKLKISDTWWMSIVGTNSKERIGYPTQKPIKLIDRIIKSSTYPGHVVLDFFAGSGTVGKSCLINNRNFILIDNNQQALEVMAQGFSGIDDISWINFDPTPFQNEENKFLATLAQNQDAITSETSEEFQTLTAIATSLQEAEEKRSDRWKSSPFEWIIQRPARSKGKLGRILVSRWFTSKGLTVERVKESGEKILINGILYAVKFSSLWESGVYKFHQINKNGPDYLICFGISPLEAHCWVFNKEIAIEHGKKQHKGAKDAEYWLSISPNNIPAWALGFGGTLENAINVIRNLKRDSPKALS